MSEWIEYKGEEKVSRAFMSKVFVRTKCGWESPESYCVGGPSWKDRITHYKVDSGEEKSRN